MVAAPARTLLTGPFVNSNHTSEFLELAAFACLACSFFRRTALNRIGWLVGAVLCGVRRARDDFARRGRGARGRRAGVRRPALRQPRGSAAPTAQASDGDDRGACCWSDSSCSAPAPWAPSSWSNDSRPAASAATSGSRCGATDSACCPRTRWASGGARSNASFPIYRTVKTPFPLRFSFLENEPLQWLVDSGWPLFALVVAGVGVVVW